MFQKETHKLNPPHTPASNGKKKLSRSPGSFSNKHFFNDLTCWGSLHIMRCEMLVAAWGKFANPTTIKRINAS